jgi:hypothetical protein
VKKQITSFFIEKKYSKMNHYNSTAIGQLMQQSNKQQSNQTNNIASTDLNLSSHIQPNSSLDGIDYVMQSHRSNFAIDNTNLVHPLDQQFHSKYDSYSCASNPSDEAASFNFSTNRESNREYMPPGSYSQTSSSALTINNPHTMHSPFTSGTSVGSIINNRHPTSASQSYYTQHHHIAKTHQWSNYASAGSTAFPYATSTPQSSGSFSNVHNSSNSSSNNMAAVAYAYSNYSNYANIHYNYPSDSVSTLSANLISPYTSGLGQLKNTPLSASASMSSSPASPAFSPQALSSFSSFNLPFSSQSSPLEHRSHPNMSTSRRDSAYQSLSFSELGPISSAALFSFSPTSAHLFNKTVSKNHDQSNAVDVLSNLHSTTDWPIEKSCNRSAKRSTAIKRKQDEQNFVSEQYSQTNRQNSQIQRAAYTLIPDEQSQESYSHAV